MSKLDDFLINFIIPHEAVYARGHYGDNNHIIIECVPGDDGGRTYAGIDEASHPHFDFEHPTLEKALEVYREEFTKYHSDSLPDPLCWPFFNCQINCGFSRARRILAKSKTAQEFLENQEQFYKDLVIAHPRLQKFIRGWLQRTKDLREYLRLS